MSGTLGNPFPVAVANPAWLGSASITGRRITRITGTPFTAGDPSVGVAMLIGGQAYAFHTWYVDGNTLAIDVDATYELLIPAGSSGTFCSGSSCTGLLAQEANGVVSDLFLSHCQATGSGQLTRVSGYAFTGASLLTVGQKLLVSPLSGPPGADDDGAITGPSVGTVATIGSSSVFTCDLGLVIGAYYEVVWQLYQPPPVPTAAVLAITILAKPNTSLAPAGIPSGFTMYAGDEWQFSAQVRGNTTIDTSVTWSCDVGTINASTGAYTAPSSPSEGDGCAVTATSNQDGVTAMSQTFAFRRITGKTVDINPGTYTPPTGWKLAGGGGLMSDGSDGVHPYRERHVILPV